MSCLIRKKMIIFLVLILLLQVFVWGCSKKGTGDNLGNSGIYGTITELTPKIQGSISLFTTDMDSFNPLNTKSYYLTAFLGNVYEGLVSMNANFEATPLLAQSWRSINLNKNWIFKLKKGVKWHSGRSFSAEDVIKTVNFIKSNSYSGVYKSFLNSVSKINKINSYTISFTLDKSDPCFDSKMIFPILSANFDKSGTNAKSYRPNGTGPYKYKSSSANTWTFVRFSNWHMRSILFSKYNQYPPFIKTVKLKKFESPIEALGGFLRGEIDVYLSSDYSAIKSIKTGYNSFDTISNKFDMLVLNTSDNILKSQLIRKALSLLINKKAIVSKCFANNAIVSNFPNFVSSNFKSEFLYNANAGEQILIDGKWNTNTSIELLVNSENQDRCRVADEIKIKLGERGVKINVKKIPLDQLSSQVDSGSYQIALLGFTTPSNSDFRFALKYYSNVDLNNLVYTWSIATDKVVRADKYSKIIKFISEQNPVIGLYNYTSSILCNRRILGTLSSDARFPYNNIAQCSVSY